MPAAKRTRFEADQPLPARGSVPFPFRCVGVSTCPFRRFAPPSLFPCMPPCLRSSFDNRKSAIGNPSAPTCLVYLFVTHQPSAMLGRC